jgi:hypothetical protein
MTPTIPPISRFPNWVLRHCDGRTISTAAVSRQSGGLGEWIKETLADEFGVKPWDVLFREDVDGLDWLHVRRIGEWDTVKQDFTITEDCVAYCQMAGQAPREVPVVVPFLEAAE